MSEAIWIPSSARAASRCTLCGKEFTASEARLRVSHAVQCASDHHDRIMAVQEEKRPSAFFKPFDPEYAAWAKQHGRIG